jgi:excisionase family DNA binding protein
MEEPILYNGATLAKIDLVARIDIPRDRIYPYQLPPAEFRAYIAACIDAIRETPFDLFPVDAVDQFGPWERGKQHSGDVDEPDDEEPVALSVPAPAQPAPVPAPADGLKTPAQAARRLNISIRTLRGLIASGELRYVNVGRGKQREKIMFTDNDLNDLIASRTRQKAQQSCPSTSPKARRSTTSISSGEVLAFTARRNGRTDAKRKR